MKRKKVKVLLLCLAAVGVMAGCGAGNGDKDTGKTAESQASTSSTQEKASVDSGKAYKEEESPEDSIDKEAPEGTKDEKLRSDTENEAAQKDTSEETKDVSGTSSWKFTAADLDGNEVTQDILKEQKLTMVNYWATFCGPCLREMPELGELNEEYADKGFQIVGVITDAYRDEEGDHNIDAAQEVVEATEASYVHLPLTLELLGGPVGNVQVVPTTIFVDENGNQVGDIQVGSKSKETWAELIDAYLELV